MSHSNWLKPIRAYVELGWGLPRPAMGWGPGGAVRTEARDWVLREKKVKSESINNSVVSDSLRLHGLQSARLLFPWNSAGKNTGVGSHSLLQGIFLTQGWNLGLLHCRQILYHLSHQGSPKGAKEDPLSPLPLAVSATTGHWRTTDKGPAHVSQSPQQNLLETACSVREEVVEHRKGGESPIKAISSTSCPSGRPGALGWGRPPLAGTQGLPGTLGQLETD